MQVIEFSGTLAGLHVGAEQVLLEVKTPREGYPQVAPIGAFAMAARPSFSLLYILSRPSR